MQCLCLSVGCTYLSVVRFLLVLTFVEKLAKSIVSSLVDRVIRPIGSLLFHPQFYEFVSSVFIHLFSPLFTNSVSKFVDLCLSCLSMIIQIREMLLVA